MIAELVWERYKAEQKAAKQERSKLANDDFWECARLATALGLKLKSFSKIHFQLISPKHGWIYNLYPSNQRIWSEPSHRGAYLKGLPSPWTLEDVIESVAVAQRQAVQRKVKK